MYRRIVLFQGKKIIVFSQKRKVIECFEYSMKYFKQTGIKVNKNTWTIKFNNELYDYTFILPKEYIKHFINN